jgi:hypothetical protein
MGIIHRKRKTFNRATRVFLELLQQEAAREHPEAAAGGLGVTNIRAATRAGV